MSSEPQQGHEWPEYFPADCPPREAGAAIGTLFRFAMKNPPTTKDFACHWERYPHYREDFVRTGRACNACGLSVYPTADSARRKQKILPALKKQHLCTVVIPRDDGKLMHTPSHNDDAHHTWWAQSSLEQQLAFIVAIEGPDAA